MILKERIQQLINHLNDGMYEREEIIAVAVLGALCGQNVFLLGPPGTAKSLISRRMASAFHEPVYFEYLMNRFSTPEEVFGPVSIKALKEDRYTRKTDKYLPKASFAFLDEIWKSSPAILNTLLTLINERIFRNGDVTEPAELKSLVAASNETPAANQGLEALYDRFIIRLMVGPISEQQNFDRLISSGPSAADASVPRELKVTSEEWQAWNEQIHKVELTPEVLTIVHLIRGKLAEEQEQLKVYVSDRRWQRAAILMKASAFFNGRNKTNHSDALLLEHCLWTSESNREAVATIVADAVRATGFDSGHSLADLDRRKEELEQEITKELYLSEDVYKTKQVKGEAYFEHTITANRNNYGQSNQTKSLLIPAKKMKTQGLFSPMDPNGNPQREITCSFDNQGVCSFETTGNTAYYFREPKPFTPEVLFHKGDRKEDVNSRLVKSLSSSITEIQNDLSKMLKNVVTRQKRFAKELETLFASRQKTELATSAIQQQVEGLEKRIKDCERLVALCQA
ncbi:MAG: AAA family ATPase [Pseudomonas profundi]|uniref:AAA family ATPase n=1 Tax=Pseudomonas profundi TaxID=1981513 RepID=UPI003002E2F3